MSFQEFIEIIRGRGIRPGLDRMHAALVELNLSGSEARVVLVGGTNGKGSTSKRLESALRALGAHTYLYTSPHLIDFEERFRFDGQAIATERLEASHQACLSILPEGKTLAGLLTPFEWMTLVGAHAAHQSTATHWILEVGLGGRLDAVNVFEPDLSILTSIAMDHCAQLGNSLQAIALEKAGILRKGKPAILGAEVASYVDWPDGIVEGRHFEVFEGRYQGIDQSCELPEGTREEGALALALAATEILEKPDSLDKAAHAASRAFWPARVQIFREGPLGIMDGAHNPDAAAWLSAYLKTHYQETRFHLVLAARADKNVEGMVQALTPHGTRITAVQDRNGFLMRALDLKERIDAPGGLPVDACEDDVASIVQGIEEPVLVLGSLYLCGELLGDLGLKNTLLQLD